ncbi:hypothetical protein [Aestuariivirga sp.]|uniref:hypothetical protein n=1 Tax=Aestuariivirga sp. TaxID=2650926 RepID=UPI0039E31406
MPKSDITPLGSAFLRALSSDKRMPPYMAANSPRCLVTFPAMNPETGPVIVDDDEEELTIFFGSITHIHVGNDDEGIAADERIRRIVARATDTLADFFEGRTEVCQRSWGGSYVPKGTGKGKIFRWSGPAEK